METDPKLEAAAQRLETLNRARAFEDLLGTAGWKELYNLQVAWVEKARFDIRRIPTGETEAALDAMRRWQLAEDLIELQAKFINDTLAEAEEIRGGVTFDEALIMEKLGHEQSKSAGDPGSGSDRTGY